MLFFTNMVIKLINFKDQDANTCFLGNVFGIMIFEWYHYCTLPSQSKKQKQNKRKTKQTGKNNPIVNNGLHKRIF